MEPLSIGLPGRCLPSCVVQDFVVWPARRSSCASLVAEPTLQEAREDEPDEVRLRLVDHQLAVDDVVAERRHAAHPHALAPRGGELVADALADHLALELGEAEQDVERQPAHRRRRVELLGDGDERDAVPLEDLDDPGEVDQRAGQPVDLVDDHDVDRAAFDVAQQPLQGRALHGAAGEAAVVVAVGHEQPALVLLALDVGLAASRWASRELNSCSRPSSVDLRV